MKKIHSKKLFHITIFVFIVVVIGLFSLGRLGFNSLSGVRAFVGGEGLWAKHQKDASYNLIKYLHTEDPAEYETFLNHLNVPIGYKIARFELEKENPDMDLVTSGFLKAGNHPDDIPLVINLYKKFRHNEHVSKAIEHWEQGDQHIARLQELGETIHQKISSGNKSLAFIKENVTRIDDLQVQLNKAEYQFSYHMGNASRWSVDLFNKLIIIFTIIGGLISLGMLLIVGNIFSELKQYSESLESAAISESNIKKELVKSKADWKEAFNTINDAITIHDKDFNIIRANKAAEELLGLSQYQILTRKCFDSYHGTSCAPAGCPSCLTLQNGVPATTEVFEPHINKHIEIKALPRFNEKQEVIGLVHVVRDIDSHKRAEEEQQKLEAQLIQSQKMESVGRLAGGIAHDFNNLLSVIIGYSELALNRMSADNPITDDLLAIKTSGEKAASLTRQLLAFSRKQLLDKKQHQLGSVIENMSEMVARMIGENIQLDIRTTPTRTVEVDSDQIEQVLMNMAVNARDAMPHGGRLLIEISEIDIDNSIPFEHEEVKYGSYVIMSITDDGIGMTEEVQEHIFEPFFTTKSKDKGTGLGMSMVYGIVKQHNGYIYVYSELGKGTTFKVYLPVSKAEDASVALEKASSALPEGNETILVVEDEHDVRQLVVDILQPLGYDLLGAANADEALEISNTHPGKIDLLLTDVIMPGKSGKKLAETLLEMMPDIKVIFMTGYTDDEVSHHGVLDSGINIINKPLNRKNLAMKIRKVLDE